MQPRIPWCDPDDRSQHLGRQAGSSHSEEDDVGEAVGFDGRRELLESWDRVRHELGRRQPAKPIGDLFLDAGIRTPCGRVALDESIGGAFGARPSRLDRVAQDSELETHPARILEGMARGFESKDVEFQQAEAERAKTIGRALSPEEREARSKRRTLELALVKARADQAAARSDMLRRMLDQAIASLETELRRIDNVT